MKLLAPRARSCCKRSSADAPAKNMKVRQRFIYLISRSALTDEVLSLENQQGFSVFIDDLTSPASGVIFCTTRCNVMGRCWRSRGKGGAILRCLSRRGAPHFFPISGPRLEESPVPPSSAAMKFPVPRECPHQGWAVAHFFRRVRSRDLQYRRSACLLSPSRTDGEFMEE